MKLNSVLSTPRTPEQLRREISAQTADRRSRRGFSMRDQGATLARIAPDVADEIIKRADDAMRGMLILPGTADALQFVGNPPLWNANPTSDEEYIWVLNRMDHWRSLLRAFSIGGDARYAQKVVSELEDWIDSRPRPEINRERAAAHRDFYAGDAWRSLEAGIRMYETWPLVLEHLVEADLVSPPLLEKMVVSMYGHGEVLEEICPIFWPKADHNHYLMENLGLLSIAVYLPQLAKSGRWLAHAMRELERCSENQMTEGGGQIEGCPQYHNMCVYFFSYATRLAADAGREFSPAYQHRLARGIAYSVHTTRPTGRGVPWGDSDSQYDAYDAVLWWYANTRDAAPLRAIARLAGLDRARSEALTRAWTGAPLDKVAAELSSSDRGAGHVDRLFHATDLKQVAMRAGWDRDALSVFFACRTPINNGHAHIDPGGFDFTALGHAMLVDPGRFTYRDCPERRMFKSAAAHNMLTIHNQDPFEYINRWTFGPQKEGWIVNVRETPGLLAAECGHRNYEPAIHRRVVAIVDDEVLLVLDEVTGLPADATVQLWFHFATDAVAWDPTGRRAIARFGDVGAVLAAISDGELSGTLVAGKVSERLDQCVDSLRLRLEAGASGTATRRFATAVLPFRGENTPALAVELDLREGRRGCVVDIGGCRRKVEWSVGKAAILSV